ncbi:MAG: hypothetical protein EZS28_009714 [Streblomastix strix]|uniref:Uncharacterized protein n=1 Tax=Streblomastix strix TaxID=222440 RepID=A0A5J4WKE1_9EUKA|nr:MAG: hypothetical protein EZS28_009714 [Streblomastix strix]
MGIDQSKVNEGNTPFSFHEPLFVNPPSRIFLNPYVVNANYGIDNVFYGESDMPLIISNSLFNQCEQRSGGAIYALIFSGGKLSINGQCNFTECKAVSGGGIYTEIRYGGEINIINQISFIDCSALQGGGIYSSIYDGTLQIEDTTFDSCTCTQPGNGGGISLYQGSSSIISITNSTFIDCKTISNSSNQRYGWGGAIFIQTNITAENLNQSNFFLTDLVFTGCSAVNSIGNNIHIQSIDTYATGEAIENYNLLTVNETINLYYNNKSGQGNGVAITAYLQTGSLLKIEDSQFILCKGNSQRGAIFLNLSNEGQVTLSISSFYQCEAYNGGGIFAIIESGGQMTIDGQCIFTECKASYNGGGIYAQIQEENSILELIDIQLENCTSFNTGGGIFVDVKLSAQLIMSRTGILINCSCDQNGGGCYINCQGSGSIFQVIGEIEFENCRSLAGGGMLILNLDQATVDINQMSFNDCQSDHFGGGLLMSIQEGGNVSVGGSISFNNCKCIDDDYNNGQGGGFYAEIDKGGQMTISGQLEFENCTSNFGGGMYIIFYGNGIIQTHQINFNGCESSYEGGGLYSIISQGGQLIIKDQYIIGCKSTLGSGGGIFSDINSGLLNIEDATFDSCTCTQFGNGGGISLIQGSSSKISITNSSFINCKTISNSSEQRYGWGGAIFIWSQFISENLNELNFLMRYLVIIGCSAVNSIGNNLHIQSIDTYATGEAIKNNNLLTINETINLYTNKLYGADYMGIDQSKVIDDNTPFSFHEPLFINPPSRIFLNPYVVNANYGIDNVFCGESDMPFDNDGNAIYLNINNGGYTSISNSSFDQCETNFQGVISASVSQLNSILELDSLIFENCYGGCVILYIVTGGKVSISNSSFSNCESSYGGGIYASLKDENSTLELINLCFENCSASDGGGLITFAQDGPLISVIGLMTFKNCSSNQNGGGFYAKCNGTESQTLMTGKLEFEKCTSQSGGGIYVLCRAYAIIVVNQLSFKDCSSSGQGGGLYVYSFVSQFNITGQSSFLNCKSQIGGGCYQDIQGGNVYFNSNNQFLFDNCSALQGGGIYSKVYTNGTISQNSISINDCAAETGGGIYSDMYNEGTVNIEDSTFNSCTCTQPGNGGALALIQDLDSIISITNSSFINCKTILNSSDSSYGWGGAIFIQTSITAENLNIQNFLLKDLSFIGCEAVNTIGNNIHIQSIDTSATGEAIKKINLLTVKYLLNPPNIISDLYTSPSYAYDYMGINQSIGNGATINAQIGSESQLLIKDSEFIQCKGSNYGGAIYLNINNEGQVTISNSTFSQCEAFNGGAIYTQIFSAGNLTIDGQSNFTECKTTSYGGGIYANISGANSLLTLDDGVKFESCLSLYAIGGGGIFIDIQDKATCIINKVLFKVCTAITGGGAYVNGSTQMNQKFNGTQFISCEAGYQGGGMHSRVFENSIQELIKVIFENCQSSNGGGGIYVDISSGSQLLISETCLFKNCSSILYGGGCYSICQNYGSQIQINGQIQFDNCSSNRSGGGIFFDVKDQVKVDINYISFKDCSAEYGGGLCVTISDEGLFSIRGISSFLNCYAEIGGGIYSNIFSGGQLSIKDQCIFAECKTTSRSGGGIQSNNYDSILKIDGTTFNRCDCTQPGNGGGISLILGISSIISITNSSFINCKTISNPSNQSYGWGGALFIESFITAENLNQTNFFLTNLVFIGCSAVNSIGNNIHIQSINTSATGEAIEKFNLLTVNGTINLYYNNSYQQDYMGIDQSLVGDGTIINNNIPLFSNSQFIRCISRLGSGGAIYLNINNEGQVTISNSSFNQCEASTGGGIFAFIESGGKLTIDGLSKFTECYAYIGGGIYAVVSGLNSLLTLEDGLKFERCNSDLASGGGAYIYIQDHGTCINNKIQFNYCNAYRGGGVYVYGYKQIQQIFNGTQFINCEARFEGGGMMAEIQSENSILELIGVLFENCTSLDTGGGMFSYIREEGQLNIKDQCVFTECKSISRSGGGIYSFIDFGTLIIEDTTFDSCTCTQFGNGGGIALNLYSNSIISISNSSFTNCKTILNSSNQRYGWGGAIFIQTSIATENLNESNFLLRDLLFNGCSAVNQIGNNIHIQSIDTYATGEAIKNINLLTVKDLLNPPNILSDLYTSSSYAYDYMGINQSIETSNWGTINLDLHNPLFEQSFTSNVPTPTYIDSINGKDIKYCGGLQTICKTIKYAINRNPTPLSEILPPDTNYSIIMTTNTELDNNILINSTTLLNRNIIIQSDGYSPEAEDDSYTKYSISTSQFSTSLFTITETGHLSLLGLHFDNLNPSATKSLISLSTDTSDNTQLQIDGDGNGAALNAQLNGTSKLTIKDGCSFTGCQSTGSGGAIYAVLNYGTVGGIFIEGTSKTSFSSCSTSDQGGAIYLDIDNVTENQFDLSGTNYSNNNEALYGKSLFIHCRDSLRSVIGIGSESRIKIGGKETENAFKNLMGYDNGNTSLAIPLYFLQYWIWI